jgi:hypothetical protein
MAKDAAAKEVVQAETQVAPAPVPVPTDVATAGKKKKLVKEISGTVVKLTEGITGTVLTFDVSKLPAEIQGKLAPFGLGHKLGDAAAGKEGQEAIDSINKVFEGLMANDWTVRAPAGEKISKSEISTKFNAMPEGAEKEKTRAALAALGIAL